MKRLFASDLHASPFILYNALQHAGEVDEVILLGDYVDIGEDPEGALNVPADVKLYGNHDVAIILGEKVWPQSAISKAYRAFLISKLGEWKIVHVVDDVLCSHAGISDMYQVRFNAFGGDLHELADWMNQTFEADIRRQLDADVRYDISGGTAFYYDEWGPLWYRPHTKTLLRKPDGSRQRQIAGHTPDEYYTDAQLKGLRINGLRLVDPFMRGKIELPGWYKYGMMKDGVIRVHKGVL